MYFSIFILTMATLTLIAVYQRYSRTGRLMSKIPGPRTLPIIGNTLDLLLDADQFFTFQRSLSKLYGKINRLQTFHLRVVNIEEPEDIEKILSTTRFNDKELFYELLRPWLNEGLLTANGAKWHKRRRMLAPGFHFNIMKHFSRIFIEHTQRFLQELQEEVGKPHTDVGAMLPKITFRTLCETVMGTPMHGSIEAIANKYLKDIHIIGQCVLYRTLRFWLSSDLLFHLTKVGRIQKQALKNVHSLTNMVISERKMYREQKEESEIGKEKREEKNIQALLDILLENEEDGNIDRDGIREEVDTFLFEGHDSIAAAITFLMMILANEPQIQDKVYEELDTVFGESDRLPTVEEISELKYLECCIKELLRMYPSVVSMSRLIKEEVVLSGYTVPAGTNVLVSIYDLHRRPDIFPEPDRFIPERFLPENSNKRHPYSYIPFSAGPRNCIGQKFAMQQLKTVMSGVLRRFVLEPVTRTQDLKFMTHLILRTTHPVLVRFTQRHPTVLK